MQVTVQGFNWEEVEKRASPEAVAEEMIFTDDIDNYSTYISGDMWPSDSAHDYFNTAEILTRLIDKTSSPERDAIIEISKLISAGDPIDEIGLSPLSDGCYFISLSPGTVNSLYNHFNSLDLDNLASLLTEGAENFVEYMIQWKNALELCSQKELGFIGTADELASQTIQADCSKRCSSQPVNSWLKVTNTSEVF